MIKKIILYNLFVFYALFLNAHEKNSKKIELLWLENQEWRIDKNTLIKWPLIVTQFVNKYLTTYYSVQWVVDSDLKMKNYTIQNIHYESFNIFNHLDFNGN